jgi:hypothetical protein
MKTNVNIAGSGRGVTIINCPQGMAGIYGSWGTEIRDLTLKSSYNAIYQAPSKISNVSIELSCNTTPGMVTGITAIAYNNMVLNNVNISYNGVAGCGFTGIQNFGDVGSPAAVIEVINSKITGSSDATSYGIVSGAYYFPSSPGRIIMKNSEINMTSTNSSGIALYNYGVNLMDIHNSIIKASTIFDNRNRINTANTQLIGNYGNSNGLVKCINAYDGNYNAFTCQ